MTKSFWIGSFGNFLSYVHLISPPAASMWKGPATLSHSGKGKTQTDPVLGSPVIGVASPLVGVIVTVEALKAAAKSAIMS